jgi:hypothetical protein
LDENELAVLMKPKKIPKLLPAKKKRGTFNYKTGEYPSDTFLPRGGLPDTRGIDELDESNNVIPNPQQAHRIGFLQ